MRPRHIVSFVIGLLLALPALGLIIGGGALGIYELAARDDGGWHALDIDRLSSDGLAVTTGEAIVGPDVGRAAVDWIDLDFRVRATPAEGRGPVFVGVAPASDLDAYLGGSMRDVMTRVTIGGAPSYRHVDGTRTALEPPGSQTFWAEHASGPGSQQLTWRAEPGRWALAILNESGEPGVNVSAQAAFRAGSLLPIAIGLVIGGLVLAAVATVLVVVGLSRREAGRPGSAAFGGPYPRQDLAARAAHAHPLVLEGRLEPNLSRGLWLVKWFLAIPHYFVLFFLWAAVGVMTVVAWFAILFTARYPRSLFEFNVGVLRWTWRVAHYSGTGGLGTDRYPPFTLDELPDDAAHLSVDYPERLSRGLIFVKWLLLLPHWIVIAVIAGTQSRTDDHGLQVGGWPGILALITLVAGIVLLATGTANQGLFDVIVGLNRWTYRVAVYALLMTDVYPPFRYDGGADEPVLGPPPGPGAPGLAPPPPAPGAQPVDLPAPDLPATVPTAPVPAAPVPSAPGSRVSTRPEQQRISP